jgi:hypothetical protein
MTYLHRVVRDQPDVLIALTLANIPVFANNYTRYFLAVCAELPRLGFDRVAFSEGALVPTSLIHALKAAGDPRSLHSMALLVEEYMSAPRNANLPRLREYLALDSVNIDPQCERWLTFIEQLRPILFGLQVVTVPTIPSSSPTSPFHTAWISEDLLPDPPPTYPCISISPLISYPVSDQFLSLLDQAACETSQRYGVGEHYSIGVDRTQKIFQLTPLAQRLPANDSRVPLQSLAHIDLWVFVMLDEDGDSPTSEKPPIDVGVPSA